MKKTKKPYKPINEMDEKEITFLLLNETTKIHDFLVKRERNNWILSFFVGAVLTFFIAKAGVL